MSSFKRVCARRIPRKMINVDRQRPHLEEESDCTALECDFELHCHAVTATDCDVVNASDCASDCACVSIRARDAIPNAQDSHERGVQVLHS
jgi:hypothetical protein